MIRELLLTAALLMPGLAYAQNPSASFSDQVVDPAVPTEALAAGFTTLALNADFSQPQYATQSNWLDCSNNNNSLIWHWDIPGFAQFPLPCNINQVTDPVTSAKVLDLQWLGSYSSSGCVSGTSYTNCTLAMTTAQRGQNPLTTYLDFPNMYIEAVYRIDNTTCAGYPQLGPAGVWTGGTSFTGPELEIDVTELTNAACGVGDSIIAAHANGTGGFLYRSYSTNNLPSGWSPTAYHKYAFLLTSDGATSTYGCSFVDDILQSCINSGETSGQFTFRNFLIASAGANCTKSGSTCNPPQYPPNTNLYIQYIRVWSCANWALPEGQTSTAANMCDGSMLYNSGGLTYWH